MDYENFIYKKEQYFNDDNVTFYWYLINKKRREGVHLYGIQRPDTTYFKGNQYNFFPLSIEAHYQKPSYEGEGSVDDCFVTGGKCYCTGSSSMAERMFRYTNPKNDEYIWKTLHKCYNDWILGGKND